jgi:hypothetical protein
MPRAIRDVLSDLNMTAFLSGFAARGAGGARTQASS